MFDFKEGSEKGREILKTKIKKKTKTIWGGGDDCIPPSLPPCVPVGQRRCPLFGSMFLKEAVDDQEDRGVQLRRRMQEDVHAVAS